MEFRIKDCQLQADDSGSLKVGGYINVTERESEMLYNKKSGKWFKEIMKKGVFKRAIERAGKNIPLLFEHNWDRQLASIEEGSLTLKEDNIGLRFDAVIKDETVYEQVKAGIINSCSFGFRALAEEVESINTRLERRFVSAIELLEVSLVKNPAYVGSLCETRALEEELEKEEREKCAPKEEVREESSEEEVKEEATESKLEDEDKEDEVAEEAKEDEEEVLAEEVETEEAETEEEERFAEEVVEPVVDVNDQLKALVEELIDAKLKELEQAEKIEASLIEEAQIVEEFHDSVEREMEEATMKQNAEIIKLRLELLKLKNIKEGI